MLNFPHSKRKGSKYFMSKGHTSTVMIDVTMNIASSGFHRLLGTSLRSLQEYRRGPLLWPEGQNIVLHIPFDGEELYIWHTN